MQNAYVLLVALGMLWVAGCAQSPGEGVDPARRLAARVDELQAERDRLADRVDALESENTEMAAQLEGTAHPINLGRTSLASVTASSVNGDRGMDNPYYGIRNAFDGGRGNAIEGINYTAWLGDTGWSQWVAVHFDTPVTVTGVTVDTEEGEPRPSRVELSFARGGGESRPAADRFDAPLHGVSGVRVHFSGPAGVEVGEVVIRGYVGPGVACEQSVAPRIAWDARTAQVAARAHYRDWGVGSGEGLTLDVREDGRSIAVTILSKGRPMARDTFDLRTGEHDFQPLVKLVPVE